jgi:hypothetical protein
MGGLNYLEKFEHAQTRSARRQGACNLCVGQVDE